MSLTIQVKRRSTVTEQGPFGPRQVETVVTEMVPLKPFESWGMYTKAGNNRLTKLAEKAMAKVEAAQADNFNRAKTRAALSWFVSRWGLLSDSKKFSEAGDTAVREVVGSFHDKLAKAAGCFEGFEVDELWDKSRNSAFKRTQKIRAKRKAKKEAKPSP